MGPFEPHWPWCTCQGWSPPGTALAISTCARLRLALPSSEAHIPLPRRFIAPLSAAGVARVAFQRCFECLLDFGPLRQLSTRKASKLGSHICQA